VSFEVPAVEDDAPHVYSIDFYLANYDTRRFVEMGSPNPGIGVKADFARLYELLEGTGVSRTKPEWITDSGCVYSYGEYAMWMGVRFSTHEPLEIAHHEFAYPPEGAPLFADTFAEHVAPWLYPLLSQVMVSGGDFRVFAQKMRCERDRSIPEQQRLFEPWAVG
jgi:hypothetical protein